MIKHLIIITLLLCSALSVVGHWIVIPINDQQTIEIISLISEHDDHVIPDNSQEYGYLIPAQDAKYLKNVTKIKWQIIEKEDLNEFMNRHYIDTVFYGDIRTERKWNYTEISFENWPVTTKRFKGELLCGGCSSYHASARLPSLLNFVYGKYVFKHFRTIMS